MRELDESQEISFCDGKNARRADWRLSGCAEGALRPILHLFEDTSMCSPHAGSNAQNSPARGFSNTQNRELLMFASFVKGETQQIDC